MSEHSGRTVDWSALRTRDAARPAPDTESLRERKKRLTRRQLSDTATQMFLERGFDAVRVSEIAEACGVSEKTAFNYFPTKESLILDRWEGTSSALREALADPAAAPVQAALRVLSRELDALIRWLGAEDDFAHAVAQFQRFGALLHSTPSLRAHQLAATERLTAEAAETLAARAGARPHDPEPLVAANALIGLWHVQARSLSARLAEADSPQRLARAVTADVDRAARVIEHGLAGWGG